MYRFRKNAQAYRNHTETGDCPFCAPPKEVIVEELPLSIVVRSSYPYDLWEYRYVTEHLLVCPRRHVPSLGDLTVAEKTEIMDVFARYEAADYNVYGRSAQSQHRTVPTHQHTHLIKISHKKTRFAFYMAKPYLLLKG